jgi:hypothetical protein
MPVYLKQDKAILLPKMPLMQYLQNMELKLKSAIPFGVADFNYRKPIIKNSRA